MPVAGNGSNVSGGVSSKDVGGIQRPTFRTENKQKFKNRDRIAKIQKLRMDLSRKIYPEGAGALGGLFLPCAGKI